MASEAANVDAVLSEQVKVKINSIFAKNEILYIIICIYTYVPFKMRVLIFTNKIVLKNSFKHNKKNLNIVEISHKSIKLLVDIFT